MTLDQATAYTPADFAKAAEWRRHYPLTDTDHALHTEWDADPEGVTARLDHEDTEREQRLRAPGALMAAALWYADQGIAVFPCEPRGKRPLGRLAPNGLHSATTNPDTIREWWTAQPDANIGLPTGHLFDVVDIDGPAGSHSISISQPDNPDPAMTPWVQLRAIALGVAFTGRGIHLYVPPTGDGNGTNLHPGVDYRGAGGYVIAPPSIHADGGMYRWAEPLAVRT
jgi:hypothetical protein